MVRTFVAAVSLSRPIAACVCLSLAAFAACKNQAPPAAEAPAAEAPAAPMPTPVAASAPAADEPSPSTAASKSRYDEPGFDLVLEPKGDYAAGKPGEADVVLSAKPPFHVNDKYPYKFKLKDDPGFSFANAVVSKDAVKFEPARATLPVSFTVSAPGKHTLAGQLSFSVCTEDKCVIEKRALALEIDAK